MALTLIFLQFLSAEQRNSNERCEHLLCLSVWGIHHYGGVAYVVDQHQFWGPGICNQHVDMSLELESLIFRNSGQEIRLLDQWTSERIVFWAIIQPAIVVTFPVI